MECFNVLKRSQRSLTSIIRNSAQRRFNTNNERLLAVVKCSIALSRFKVVLNRIPKYLKVCTCSITLTSNTNSWHGSAELNTMIFVFFTFTVVHVQHKITGTCLIVVVIPPLTSTSERGHLQKNNSQRASLLRLVHRSHFLPSKRPSKASIYSPNSKGLREQPCFTPCWNLKLEVTPSLGCLMHTVSLAYIACKHRKKCPSTPKPANTCHNTSHGTVLNAFLKSTK